MPRFEPLVAGVASGSRVPRGSAAFARRERSRAGSRRAAGRRRAILPARSSNSRPLRLCNQPTRSGLPARVPASAVSNFRIALDLPGVRFAATGGLRDLHVPSLTGSDGVLHRCSDQDCTGYPENRKGADSGFWQLLTRSVAQMGRALLAGRGGGNAEAIAVVRAGGTEGVFASRQIPDG